MSATFSPPAQEHPPSPRPRLATPFGDRPRRAPACCHGPPSDAERDLLLARSTVAVPVLSFVSMLAVPGLDLAVRRPAHVGVVSRRPGRHQCDRRCHLGDHLIAPPAAQLRGAPCPRRELDPRCDPERRRPAAERRRGARGARQHLPHGRRLAVAGRYAGDTCSTTPAATRSTSWPSATASSTSAGPTGACSRRPATCGTASSIRRRPHPRLRRGLRAPQRHDQGTGAVLRRPEHRHRPVAAVLRLRGRHQLVAARRRRHPGDVLPVDPAGPRRRGRRDLRRHQRHVPPGRPAAPPVASPRSATARTCTPASTCRGRLPDPVRAGNLVQGRRARTTSTGSPTSSTAGAPARMSLLFRTAFHRHEPHADAAAVLLVRLSVLHRHGREHLRRRRSRRC